MTSTPTLSDIGALPEMRCRRSGHICGTDTWAEGYECHCIICQKWLSYRDGQSSALAAIGPLIEAARAINPDDVGAAIAWIVGVEIHYANIGASKDAEGLRRRAQMVLQQTSKLLDALSSFPAAPGGMWRLIETAPRNGKPVLVSDGFGVWISFFSQGRWWSSTPNAAQIPTHWQPLPAPPSATSSETRDE